MKTVGAVLSFGAFSGIELPRLVGVVGLIGFVGGPGCAVALPAPTAADSVAAQPRWPGTTAADLERGRAVYVRRCGGCHHLHHPSEEKPERWPDLVRKMAPRAKLAGDEARDVLRYLVVLSETR